MSGEFIHHVSADGSVEYEYVPDQQEYGFPWDNEPEVIPDDMNWLDGASSDWPSETEIEEYWRLLLP